LSNRPYINLGIERLEQIFKDSGIDSQTLKTLENELVHRSTTRAVQLLAAVRKRIALPQAVGAKPNLSLFGELVPLPPPARARELPFPPVVKSEPVLINKPEVLSGPAPAPRPVQVPPSPDPKVAVDAETASPMSPEEASKVLHVSVGASWDVVEQARREIVQRSRPDHLRSLSPESRHAQIGLARRANAAAKALFEARARSNS
jgi:hypothetical protein